MMRFEKRGIVAKICADKCIILTPEGTYQKIPLPAPDTRVGAEVFYGRPRITSPLVPWLMVASFLFLFMGYPLLHQAMLPQAVAYVSLDIDPSLEMAVDEHMRVIEVQCFNDDATNLVKNLSLTGKGLNDAVTEVINQAVAQNYLKAGQNNVIISTISQSETAPPRVDQVALNQLLEDSMASRGYTGQVKIYAASEDFRLAAANQNLSAGKYLVYQQLRKSGQEVSAADINGLNLSQLHDSYELDLLPNYKKIMIQTALASQDMEITVDDDGQRVTIEEYAQSHRPVGVGGAGNYQQPDTNVSRALER